MINKLLGNYKGEFAKNVLTVFTGMSFSQIIPILVSPVLTRIYSPAEFGVLALFMATGMIFGNISTFQYDAAIMLPKEEKDAINLLALSIFLTLCMTFISFIIIFAFNSQLVYLMDNEKVANWLYLVPLSVLLTGVFRSFSFWASRNKQFKLIAARNITQTTTTAGVKLISGFAKYTNGGLIIGTLAGQFVATALLLVESFRRSLMDTKLVNRKSIFQNAKKYKEFPLFTNWQGFFDMLNDTGSRYIISNFFDSTILGLYSFTFGILERPLQIIGQSVAQVYYQRGAEIYYTDGDLWILTKKIIKRLVIAGLIIFMPILIFGKTIFLFVFGDKWAIAGLYAQILVPWLLAKFILSPMSKIPIIVGKQKQFFFVTIATNILVPTNFLILKFYINNFNIILLINSLSVFTIYILLLFWFKKITTKIIKK